MKRLSKSNKLKKWHQQYKETGNLEYKKPCLKAKRLDPKKLISYLENHPDAYLKKIGKVFNCSDTVVQKAFKGLRITQKKMKRYKEQYPIKVIK